MTRKVVFTAGVLLLVLAAPALRALQPESVASADPMPGGEDAATRTDPGDGNSTAVSGPSANSQGGEGEPGDGGEGDGEGGESERESDSDDGSRQEATVENLLKEVKRLGQLVEADDSSESTRTTCSWRTGECAPRELDVHGGQASTVVVTELPAKSGLVVTARSGFVYRGDVQSRVLGGSGPRQKEYLTWQEKVIDGRLHPTVTIDLHVMRAKKDWGNGQILLEQRAATPGSLAIVVNAGDSAEVVVTVSSGDEAKAFVIPLRYQRWYLDAGGAFLFSSVVDQELELKPTTDEGMVQVAGVRDADSFATDTAVILHFVPANYRSAHFALGIASNTGRSPSFYVGAGRRARQLGKRALVSVSIGFSAVERKEFPDVAVGDVVSATSDALKGDDRYRIGGFIGITLGFTAGVNGNTLNSSEEQED